MNYKNIFLSVFVLLMFLGCGPKYKIVYEYTQPISPKDRDCTKQCHYDFQSCEDNCALNYNQCIKNAEIIGKQNYEKSMDEYQKKYNNWLYEDKIYRLKLEKYEDEVEEANDMFRYFSHECKKNRQKFACEKKMFYKNKIHFYNRPIEPTKPKEPNLEDEIKSVKNRMCSNDCRCKEKYNSCFVSCGGKVTSKKVCIENCK